MAVTVLSGMGIEVLDQRRFLSPWIVPPGVLTARPPTPEEAAEIREGLALAHRLASFGIGQTIVRSLGVTVAVEAAEGTDATIRRGARLAGRGAVVVKAAGESPTTASTSPRWAPPRSRRWPRAAPPRSGSREASSCSSTARHSSAPPTRPGSPS